MQTGFSENLGRMADDMGVSFYQRFTLIEASLFLRCPATEIEKLTGQAKLEYIQVTDGQIEFFGYQLLQYLLSSVRGQAPSGFAPNDKDRIIRSREVQELTGLSRTTLWRMERKGEFPDRLPLSAGSVGWRLSEVEEWVKSK